MRKTVFITLFCSLSLSAVAQNSRAVSLSCYIQNPNARIFTEPDLSSVDLDISGGLGTSWGFEVDKEITTNEGVFFLGTLINPKGNPIDGIFYILKSEWKCAATSFVPQKIVEQPKPIVPKIKPPKPYTLYAYKRYTCDNRHLDLNNLNYKNSPSKTRNYSIVVNEYTIIITDIKNNARFEYKKLDYNKVKGYDHYVDTEVDHLSEFYIDRANKIFIDRGVIDNGFRDTYSVYLLK